MMAVMDNSHGQMDGMDSSHGQQQWTTAMDLWTFLINYSVHKSMAAVYGRCPWLLSIISMAVVHCCCP
jgi:hypothetical protein